MKLDKLCILFTDGDWIESKDQSDSGIRLIQTGNIGNGEFLYKNDKAKYISVDTFKRLNCKEVFPNDILVSRLPEPVGRGCIIPDIGEKMITAVDCTICRINENLVDRKYFCYFLESNAYKTQLEQHVTGTTRKRISRKNLSSIEIDIPEQAKQKEVVYKLDRLKKIIQNYNRELDLLDELVRARFVEMFGDPITNDMLWNTVKLNDVCYGIGDGLHGTPEYDEYGDYPFINGNNLKNGKIEITPSTKMVNEDIYRKYFIKLTENTILLSINGTLGNLALYNGEKVVLGKSACYCNLIPDINRIFVCSVMKTDAFSNFLESNATSSTIKNIGLKVIREFELIVPPLELQNQFASFVEEIDKSRSRIQKSLEASQELFDSLMQEYFG